MGIIDVKNLTFAYDESKTVVNDVSFSIEEGSYVTIIGHNGSGKSTIAKLLAGLEAAKSGDIWIDGILLNDENLMKVRNRIGIVFQNPDNQFIGSTVRDDIAFGLENHCVPQEEMNDIINTFAERVGMTAFLDKEPTRMSGGQKQRVAIAGVLAMNPKILIFDEATSMLDPQGKDEIKKVIMDLHNQNGLTIISITHDIDEMTSGDLVLVMADGKLVMQGKPEEIFAREAELKKIQLDIPFALKMSKELRRRGVNVSDDLTTERLVDELCQLHSNM